MAQMQIRGNTQIMAGTITNAEIATTAAIASSKLADGANWIKKDGTVAFTADQSHGGFKITSLGDPTVGTDAATKAYVDSLAGTGLSVKSAVKFTTTANITLSGLGTQAGGDWSASLTAGDRVLVKDQSTGAQNGIYVASATAWSRSADFNVVGNILQNSFFFVGQGVTLADSGWVLTTDPPYTVDTTPLAFAQFSGAGTLVAGNGLSKTGNTFDVNPGNGITITGDAVTVLLADSTLNVSGSGLKLSSLTSAQFLVGNGSNVATGVSMSGDATLANTGAVTVAATIQRTAGFVDEEIPTGSINGSNTAFTLANTPVASTSVKVHLNGIRLQYGAGNDFTVSGTALTMVTVPQTGDKLIVDYRK